MDSMFISTALRGSNRDPSSRKSTRVGYKDDEPDHKGRIPFNGVDEIDVKRAFPGNHEFAAYRRMRLADRPDEAERLRAALGQRCLSNEHNDILANRLFQSKLHALWELRHWWSEELHVLAAADGRVQIHDALHAVDGGELCQPAAQIVDTVDVLGAQRDGETVRIVNYHYDGVGVDLLKFTAQQFHTPAGFCRFRQSCDVAGTELNMQERHAEQDEKEGRRQQHPPGMSHYHGRQGAPESVAVAGFAGIYEWQSPGIDLGTQNGEQRREKGHGVRRRPKLRQWRPPGPLSSDGPAPGTTYQINQ